MPATLKEIAKYSGVSIATVSLALNNKAVCARTREKVLKAAEKLQYRPSTLARSLRTQKT
jgi:DNA-binding LacI/PurR family transcriptional regulator